jgi:polar amino acid transport system permease protein
MKILGMLDGMLAGTLVLLKLFALTLLFALPLGLVIALGRMSSRWWISKPIRYYQLIMRGTPLMLQLMFVFYGPYYIVGRTFDRFTSAVMAFVINYAAYFAEIYRSGIESIPSGQFEAAKALGYSRGQAYARIVLPQVVKRILPPMANELMTLVKDTALAQTIAVAELFRATFNAQNRTGSITPIVVAGVIYFVLNSVVENLFILAEKKLGYYR